MEHLQPHTHTHSHKSSDTDSHDVIATSTAAQQNPGDVAHAPQNTCQRVPTRRTQPLKQRQRQRLRL